MNDTITKETLMPFCSVSPAKPHFRQPSSQGEFTYACDGRILIRVARLADVPEVEGYVNMDRVMGQFHAEGDWQPAPMKFTEAKIGPCHACGGQGTHFCEKCGEDHDCARCEGKGTKEEMQWMEIDGRRIQNKFLRLVAALPGAEFNTTGDENTPVSFRFAGGIGLVMPLLKRHE